DEGLLHRMQLVAFGKAFDDGDVAALGGERERQAEYRSPVIDENRAGAALAVIAALFASSQADMCAQRIQHGGARIDREQTAVAIDAQGDVDRQRRIRRSRRVWRRPCRARRQRDDRASRSPRQEHSAVETGSCGGSGFVGYERPPPLERGGATTCAPRRPNNRDEAWFRSDRADAAAASFSVVNFR